MGPDRVRVLPRIQRALQGLVNETVHHSLGAGELHRAVVSDDQRLADEAQVAIVDRDTERLLGRGSGLPIAVLRATKHVTLGLRRPAGIARARRPASDVPHGEHRRAAGRRRDHGESIGGTGRQQVEIRLEGLSPVGEIPMGTVELPGADSRQLRARQGDPSITVVLRVEIDQAFLSDLVSVGRKACLPDDEDHGVLRRRRSPCASSLRRRSTARSSTSCGGTPHS